MPPCPLLHIRSKEMDSMSMVGINAHHFNLDANRNVSSRAIVKSDRQERSSRAIVKKKQNQPVFVRGH
jgi:hypothetical protein